jgi:uncharacterized protein
MQRISWWTIAKVSMALLASGATALSAAVVNMSFGLTNPVGYEHHPGASELPPGSDGIDPQRDFGLAFQNVTFQVADGSTLRGWLVPGPVRSAGQTPTVGVVTVHGRGMDRRAFLPHLPMLHDLGATILLFDMREHGLSDGASRGMSMGYREAADVSVAVHFLKSTGINRVVVLGMSLGAGSAILAAAADTEIDAVIADSPFATMQEYVQHLTDESGLRRVANLSGRPTWWPDLVVGFSAWRVGAHSLQAPIDVVDRIAPRPLLLMHGTADTSFGQEHSQQLFSRAAMPKELWLAQDAQHIRIYQAYPVEYRQHLAAVLRALVPVETGSV